MKRVWTWDEATGCIYEHENLPNGDVEAGLVARVVSDSAADPGDGDGPIMAAARDLLDVVESLLVFEINRLASMVEVPIPWQRAAAAIKKARA